MKPAQLIACVCRELELTPAELKSRARQRRICEARWIVSALLREEYGMTFEEIGHRLKRDHGTICHALRRIEQAPTGDKPLMKKFERVKRRIER